MLEKKVRDLSIDDGSDACSIIAQMFDAGGFMARNLAIAARILEDMLKDDKCFRFISFVGAPIATGLRGVVRDMLKEKMFDAVITTCGALDHDIARSSADYYAGDFGIDDAMLADEKIHRLGNLLIPLANYGPLIERKVQAVLEEVYADGTRECSSSEICKAIGMRLDESSFLYWAARNSIPVFVPGIMDGAVGTQLWLFAQRHRDFRLNLFKDADMLAEVAFRAERTGALMLGGGIAKHHTLWWNQFRGGLDYAVYITTAVEYDGSLSGALVREAISWGKVKQDAKQVTVYGEATLLLPFLYTCMLRAWKEREWSNGGKRGEGG
ncbi:MULTISPECIES: deoxyhypusine synthase [Candidatus Nitrosocaldus]|jgi:deoxyhypusine synthase|uniref:Putative deoxyhypusine synthase n=1 Tax=Candidatus Nitrosocaldus cavascurensis TaxID=2058097 RepID=A0A2K5ART4_9ARCH|nr:MULTISPECIES: deoxyhypusine synthase [Candidatus Nitrosocaldus]SPC34356.1 putative deoxyhypusine synthase [Candidatus Nitrosocaldus cavascurensis]